MRSISAAAVVAALAACGHSGSHSPDAHGPDDAAIDAPVSPDAAVPADLFAVWPPTAVPGQTVMLEGDFTDGGLVMLPGGTMAPVNVLGPHRASVVVPVGTGDGDLAMTSEGGTSSSVKLRGLDFEIGLREPESYEQASVARQPSVLADSLTAHGSIRIGDWLYLFGGRGSAGFTTAVERARVYADGSLGPFAVVSGVSLRAARSDFTTAVIGHYVYVFGGGGLVSDVSSSIERAPILADDTVGTFESVAGTTVVPRYEATGTVIGAYVYLIGGTATASQKTVERAPIHPDGSLGSFSMVTGAMLVDARGGAASIVIGDKLYMIGGGGLGAPDHSIEVATIAPDGDISTFSRVPDVALISGRYGFCPMVIGDGLYIIGGGLDDSNDDEMIERAPIHDDGTLGPFVATGVHIGPHGRMNLTVALANHYLYLLGGNTPGGGDTGERYVDRLSIDADDQLGPPVTANSSLAAPAQDAAIATIGSRVYVVGGTTTGGTLTGAVQRAHATHGSLDSFTTLPTVTLVTPRAGASAVVTNGYLYVIGGVTASGVTATVERAPILDDDLGPFEVVAPVLATPRAHASTVVGRGYGTSANVFIIGGVDANGAPLASVEVASIDMAGALGSFSTASATLSHARHSAGSALVQRAFNSGFYVIGGVDANGYVDDVERASLGTDGNIGMFLHVGTLTNPRSAPGTAVIGDHLYVLGGVDSNGPLTSIESAPIQSDVTQAYVSLGAFTFVPNVTLAVKRAAMGCVVVANSLFLIGGHDYSTPLASVERADLH